MVKVIGIDNIFGKILKVVVLVIFLFFMYIINYVIILCCFLDDWKVVRVLLFYKKGFCNLFDNYRLIFILFVISKIIERILYD